jgi:hypothetical protein
MSSILTVNGTPYDQSARAAAALLVDAWGWSLDADYWLEFSEYAAGPTPQFSGPTDVSLSVGGTTVFTGDLVSSAPMMGRDGITWGYRCLGLGYRANWLPVTAIDGSGIIRYNVPFTDVDNYVVTLAGKSVGDILSDGLSQHSAALSAAGITTDATTASQLAALTLVPQDQVIVSGERLWQALQSVLARWMRNYRLVILPSGLVRVLDVNGGSTHTLTVGTDPVEPPLLSRNWTNCATRVSVRGKGNIASAYVSVLKSTLTPAWSAPQEAAWTYNDYLNPPGASSHGTVTTVNSPTQVTVSSADATEHWTTNFWNGLQAWVWLTKSSGSGLTYIESRPITACSSLSAGGTATLTLGYDLENSSASAFDSYQIIGTNVPLASGGRMDVWRLYDVTDPGGLVADHLVTEFPAPTPFYSANGQAVSLVTTPMAQIVSGTGSGPAQFQVLPQTGQIIFVRPVVESTSTIAQLNAGGASVVAPVDVYCLLAYSRGALSVPFPADIAAVPQYSGTAYSQANLARTQTVDVDTWQYAGNTSVMGDLAEMLQASVRDTLIEGTAVYQGYYSTVQDPSSGGGHKITFAGTGYSRPADEADLPVRAVTYRYLTTGGGLLFRTEIKLSTRNDPRTGESQYLHLSAFGTPLSFGSQLAGGFGPGAPTMGDAAGFTPESLGLDKSAMELSGFDPANLRDDRRKWAERKPQGLRGVTTTDEQRRMTAEVHEQERRDSEESADRLAGLDSERRARVLRRDPSTQTGLAYGQSGKGRGQSDADAIERDRKESQRRLIARKDRERSQRLRDAGISNLMADSSGGGGMGPAPAAGDDLAGGGGE